MNKAHRLSLVGAILVLLSSAAQPAFADGIIIPDPPICGDVPCPPPIRISQLAIESHNVRVSIEDQVAITRVDQVFRNDNEYTLEGTYIFPLPADAAVGEFKLWIDGEPVTGEILTKDEARRRYEEIVRKLRDPALLEYIDRGAVQASIFPIEPGETRRIELEYTQVLEADAGLVGYRYPLNTEKFSTQPLEEVTIRVEVRSGQSVKAIYSPTHSIAVDHDDDFSFVAGYEDSDVLPDRDFQLYYTTADQAFGLNLLTFRDPAGDDDDGFFMLIAAPGFQADDRPAVAKDVLLVIDQSGSMEGEKFRQAQQAMRYVLSHLNPEDRFNAIAFSTGTSTFSSRMQPASEAEEAIRWAGSLSAQGSTDINRALLEAASFANVERPTFLIFLTDGLPTEGETDPQAILGNLGGEAPSSLRLFAFGVGYDVDTFLLDSLAEEHHGATSYVTPDQAIDEIISAFYAKVTSPVLTDLELDFGQITVYDLQPGTLPDLFAGGQMVLFGRYRGSGSTTIRLRGEVNGEPQSFRYQDQNIRSRGGPDFLPRLWATRKIGALLKQIRLEGANQEIVDQIVRLSIRYGIVTPYTSYLVTEPSALGREAQEDLAAETFRQLLATPTQTSGQAAVQQAAAEGEIEEAEVVQAPSGEAADAVRLVGDATFQRIDGVWIDTRFDPETMTPLRVPFLSDEYFELAASSDDMSDALALGARVIAVSGGVAYEIVPADEQGDPLPEVNQQDLDNPPGLMPYEEPDGSDTGQGSTTGNLLPVCASAPLAFGLAFAGWSRRRRGRGWS